MSYKQTINPKRRLKVEDFIDEWDAAHKSPLNVAELSEFLEESIVSIVKNGGVYASN